MSKIGLHGITHMLAQALAPRVRVMGIAPGLTLQGLHQTSARFAEQHVANPLAVGVTPDDLVRALRYIVATPSVSGDTLIVDSGEHLTGPAARRRLLQGKEQVSRRRIFLRDFRLEVSIGIHDFEKEGPQTVVVNVDLVLAPADKAHSDRIANVLNYDVVHDGIMALAGSRHFNLQETLVDAILDLCLAQPGVIEARVSTEKPDVYSDCRVGYEAVRRKVAR